MTKTQTQTDGRTESHDNPRMRGPLSLGTTTVLLAGLLGTWVLGETLVELAGTSIPALVGIMVVGSALALGWGDVLTSSEPAKTLMFGAAVALYLSGVSAALELGGLTTVVLFNLAAVSLTAAFYVDAPSGEPLDDGPNEVSIDARG